jgi:hypothetical protein
MKETRQKDKHNSVTMSDSTPFYAHVQSPSS